MELRIDNLTQRYRGVTALKGVNTQLRGGDTCLLLPPSLSECTYSGLFSTMPLPSDGHLSLSEVLADFPVNLLYRLAQEDTP